MIDPNLYKSRQIIHIHTHACKQTDIGVDLRYIFLLPPSHEYHALHLGCPVLGGGNR